MQAIVTKYLGQTNYKPSRMVAKAEFGRVVVSYDHGLTAQGNHAAAAAAYIQKMYWGSLANWRGGQIPGGSYVWVYDTETIADILKIPSETADSADRVVKSLEILHARLDGDMAMIVDVARRAVNRVAARLRGQTLD